MGDTRSLHDISHGNSINQITIDKINKYGEKTGYSIKVGFSDDDLGNTQTMYNFLKHKLYFFKLYSCHQSFPIMHDTVLPVEYA